MNKLVPVCKCYIGLFLFACLLVPLKALGQGGIAPLPIICEAGEIGKNITGHRVHETICGTIGKFVAEKACTQMNPWIPADPYWKNCVVCVWDGTECDTTYGDPHFISGDGLRFDFQGEGDYVVAMADGLEVQARYVGAGISVQTGVAVRSNESTVVIENSGKQNEQIYVDGQPITLEDGDWWEFDNGAGIVQTYKAWTRIEITDKVSLAVSGDRLIMGVDSSLQATRQGIFGNGNDDPTDDLQTIDGTLVDASDRTALYGEFLQSWQRRADASLFITEFNYSDIDLATTIRSLSDFDDGARTAARQQCLDAGLLPGQGLEECTFDVLSTGSNDYIDSALQVAGDVKRSVSALGIRKNPIQINTFDLQGSASVSAGVPGTGAGELEVQYEIDRYNLGASADALRTIKTTAPCNDANELKIQIESSTLGTVEAALDCTQITILPADADSITVFSAAGDTAIYAFNITEATSTSLGELPVGRVLSGAMQSDIVTGEIPSIDGGRVYVGAADGASCSASWRVQDDNGNLLTNSVPACKDLGVVDAAGDSTLSIVLERSNIEDRYAMRLTALQTNGVPATLDAPASTNVGGTITVTWAGPGNMSDFIAIAKPDAVDNEFLISQTINLESNTVQIRLPGIAGDYEIRYILNAGRRVVASIPITVTPGVASVEAPASVVVGATIDVEWTGPGNPRDFIVIAEPGAIDNAFLVSQTISIESNTVQIRLPGIAGEYEVRYIVDSNRQVVASAPITVLPGIATLDAPASVVVGATIDVMWTGPGNPRDFIVIAETGAIDNAFLFSRTITAESNMVEIRLPGIPGNYEVRYIVDSNRQAIAAVPIIVEAAEAQLSAPATAIADGTVTVTWTGPGNLRDFIVFANPGAIDNDFLTSRTINAETNTVDIRVPATPGNYEIRYIVDSDRQKIGSTSVTVMAAN